MPSEIENRIIARKSLVALQAIKAGELFTNENMTTKRPGSGVSPIQWENFLGRTASRNYEIDELIDET
jgi:N,N'-diacetyllegionaminate synthase